jgi:hypothetical protein
MGFERRGALVAIWSDASAQLFALHRLTSLRIFGPKLGKEKIRRLLFVLLTDALASK